MGHGDDALQATPKRVDALALEHVKCKQVSALRNRSFSSLSALAWHGLKPADGPKVQQRTGGAHVSRLSCLFLLCLFSDPLRSLSRPVSPRQVACGFAYTAAVTTEGQVYTWGAGENGRLGLGDELDKMRPGREEANKGKRASGFPLGLGEPIEHLSLLPSLPPFLQVM